MNNNENKRKGFTLVEVLAVVVVLGLLVACVIPIVSRYLKEGKDTYNKELKENMVLVAKNFYAENKERLPQNSSFKMVDYVFLSELSSKDYAKGTFKDADKKNCVDKSYVVAINEGVGVTYHPCMVCGSNSYITSKEKAYCNAKNCNVSDEKSFTCKVSDEETTDSEYKLSVEAKDNSNSVNSFLIINKSTNKIQKELAGKSNNGSYVKDLIIKDYGTYDVLAINNCSKVKCSTVVYDSPETIKVDYDLYFVSKDSYDKHKNSGYTSSELEKLGSYDYKDGWKKGYVYVKLKYDSDKVSSIKTGNLEIKNKYFFIEEEGDIQTKLVVTYKNKRNSNKEIFINTKLDRSAPKIDSITNTSKGVWTKDSVTIGAKASDKYSGIKEFMYTTGSSWNKVSSSGLFSKTWNNDSDKNLTLKIKAIDGVGNESEVKTTPIKIDVTPPYYYTKYVLGWGYSDNNYYCYNYAYHFKDKSSGVYRLKYGHCYPTLNGCNGSNSAYNKCKNKDYEIRNWNEAGYKKINYCVKANNKAQIYFSVCDLVGNCKEFGTYNDVIPG